MRSDSGWVFSVSVIGDRPVQLTGLASWYVFFRESDPDFKQSYVTLSEPDAGKQTEGELALVDKLKVIHH